jgi:hypothetical protein
MTLHQHDRLNQPSALRFFEALDYEAPFVIEKLLKDRIVETGPEGERLFGEVKRFIVLVQSDDTLPWEMYSSRVDEAWHQFILFTAEYMEFCNRFFGRYMAHSPHSAPSSNNDVSGAIMSFGDFKGRYEALYNELLPDVWYDHKNIIVSRRTFNDRAGGLTLHDNGVMVDLLDEAADVLLSVNRLARDALEFICQTGVFYVRELPGGLTDEEKVALAIALVKCRVLRVGS